MRKSTPKDYAIALYTATRDVSAGDLKNILKQFTKLLYRSGQLKQIDEIIAEFIKYDRRQEGIVDIKVTSARPLTAKLLSEIKKAFGAKVEATEEIDEDLIGGIMVRTEDKIFDASLRRQLQVLKQTLS